MTPPEQRFPLDLDSRAIRDVQPLDLGGRAATGAWSCTRCSALFPVRDSYAVTFANRDLTLMFVACPACAERYLVPGPVVVDVAAVERCSSVDLEPVLDQVVQARSARRLPASGALAIRATDLRRLAQAAGTTPRTLVDRLDDERLTTSV